MRALCRRENSYQTKAFLLTTNSYMRIRTTVASILAVVFYEAAAFSLPVELRTPDYIQDDLYNVVALTDENGDVVERYTYDDYGYPTIYDELGNAQTESQYGNIFLFNGRRWDDALELYDYRTRYYDPAMGRFLRVDTIGPWGDNNNLGNAYAYVGNNPWTHNDPYGEQSSELQSVLGYRPEQQLYHYLTKFWTDFFQFEFGGHPDYENNVYVGPKGGLGGKVGGRLNTVTLRFVPLEENPTQISLDGIEIGAAGVPIANSVLQLYSGTTVTGLPADPQAAAIGLVLDVAGSGLFGISTRAVGKLTLPKFHPSIGRSAPNPRTRQFPALSKSQRLQLADISSPGSGRPSGLVRGTNPSRVVFDGMEVRAVRKLSHIDDSTLIQMARDGFSARDINGRTLILHHLDQNPAGPLAEMVGKRHSVHNRVQHPLGNVAGVGLTREQRATFDNWRREYWKARALEELTVRGLTP